MSDKGKGGITSKRSMGYVAPAKKTTSSSRSSSKSSIPSFVNIPGQSIYETNSAATIAAQGLPATPPKVGSLQTVAEYQAGRATTPVAPETENPVVPMVPSAPGPIAEEPVAPEDTVATSQPNPSTVNAQPFTNPDGSVASGATGGVGQGTQASSYEQGFNSASAAGAVTPTSGAAGSALVSQYSPSNPSNPGTQFVQSDPYIASLVSTWQQYISPANQRASLTETYSKMLKKSGIEAIDMNLLNMKNVIEGSEDDIRTEVTKAGGFATDSQVLALTNARNKQLIKNYNTLLETRNSKEKYLETAIQLEQKDRESADRRFESAFSMGMQIADYHQKMQTNAQDRMRWNATQMGFDGLYDSTNGDPYTTGLVEQTLGLPKGGLLTAATQARQARALAGQEKQLDLQLKGEQILTSKATRAKIYSDINTNNQTNNQKLLAVQNQATKAATVLGKVTEAMDLVGGASTGLFGSIANKFGGTSARNLRSTLDTITANLSFDTLQEMRNASKTGGALGSVSERELDLLGATVASLNAGQSASQLKNSLNQVKDHYTNWLTVNGYSVTPDGDLVQIK